MINKWKFDLAAVTAVGSTRSTRSPGKAEISPTMLRYVWDEININHEKTEVTACDSELEIFTKQNDAKWGSQTCRNNHKGSSTKMGTKKMIPQLANIWRFQLFNHQTSEDPGKCPGKSSMWSGIQTCHLKIPCKWRFSSLGKSSKQMEDFPAMIDARRVSFLEITFHFRRSSQFVVYNPSWLVVSTTLKNTKVAGTIIPNIWKNKKCSKPPTS